MQAAGPSSHSAASTRTHKPDLCLRSDNIVGIPNCILPWPFDTLRMTFLLLEDCPLISYGSTARGGFVMALEGSSALEQDGIPNQKANVS
jgi:hypothetical protein